MDQFWTTIRSSPELESREIGLVLGIVVVTFILVTIILRRMLGSEAGHGISDRRGEINESRKRRRGAWTRPQYPNGWYAVLDSDKLGTKAATEAVICDKEIVIWRGENGVAYVADAYCPHLGAHLGVEGEVKGNCIQCPFHNWQFDGSQAGKLTCIPYSQKVIENVHLKMWPSLERNGFIWVWYHSEDESASWEPPLHPESISGHVVNLVDTTAHAHVQDIAENSADISHFNAVHGSLVSRSKSILYALSPVSLVWEADWKGGVGEGAAHTAQSNLKVGYLLFRKWTFGQVPFTLRQHGPGIGVVEVRSWFGRLTVLSSNTPLGPMHTRCMQKAFCSNRAIQSIQWLSKLSLLDQIFRDIGIWNRQRPTATPTFSREDATIKSYRKWYAQFYSSHWKDQSLGSNNNK